MKYEIIKTENYLLVIDDSEIKEGDYRVNIQRGYIKLVDDNPEYYNKRNDVFKKVIAHLPLNNSPILRDVDLLPPLEEEPTEEAKQRAENYMSLKGALEPKQVTLEEASWIFNPLKKLDGEFLRDAFVKGAKWQQERMFELVEEYNQMLIDPNVHDDHKEKSFKEWFEQFKNK